MFRVKVINHISSPQVTLAYMKHLWKADHKQNAFDLLGKFVNQLQPRDSHEQLSQETNQLLAQSVPHTLLHFLSESCLHVTIANQ